ncbi:MAG: host attachment protein [Phenylobacterium sp.]|jgi:protein required for attachment to host cells|uniref:host attachment family protein n=1 Tax=Phenylobacterium sp. TaxID=1871053 RepID=UPI001B5994B1|nr:host attachment protein [Phenylobacterium sp.]MBP7651666.1 host attachment protein [Phenylobacterium sp.]MBP7817562.1 host attachment protein [Phenylobacterium sp.]MBP9231728.1 host attachment protein [Phenylobacterium sp.]MBP9756903.1 host attachment protein [Phenylobacterium sp.]
MQLPRGATVAVADGVILHLYRNAGDEVHPKLTALPPAALAPAHGGGEHHASSANPDHGQQREDGFAAATVAWLNEQALAGKIDQILIIAAPKTLGEMRRHYHKALEGKLVGELAKDLTGHAIHDIEAAILHA